jgi:large subunit ribosomal protein L32e
MRLRLAMNRRMPRWRRMEDWVKVKLADSGWRRPKGNDNKIRLERKGYPPRVKVGYGKPRLVRNLHPSGYRIAIVHSPVELDKLNPEKDAIMLGGDVGLRKRIEIIRRARERGFKVLNITKEEAKLFAEEKAQG